MHAENKELLKRESVDVDDLYAKMFIPLCLYAQRFFINTDEAKEVVQVVMVKLLENPILLRNAEYPEKYIYRAVYNECIGRLNKLKVEKAYKDYRKMQLVEIEMETFEETYFYEERGRKVAREVEKLPYRDRLLLELRFVNGKKYSEIAVELNLSKRTVETYIQHIVKKLRKRVGNCGFFFLL